MNGPTTLCCSSCGREIGSATATTLVINGFAFERPVTLTCQRCGHVTRWRPTADDARPPRSLAAMPA